MTIHHKNAIIKKTRQGQSKKPERVDKMMENTNVKRITKAMRYADIKAILSNETPVYGTTIDDALAFIDKEVTLLTKKNTGNEKKPTAKQKENEQYKERILNFLITQTEGITCTEVQKNIPEFGDFSNQKIAKLMNQLLAEHKVTKAIVKGRSLFAIA